MRRYAHEPLSRERIIGAALKLADEQGLDGLSMRKLGARLGVEATSLYNHVAGKPVLLIGMLERLLDQLDIRLDGDLPWSDRVRLAAHSFRRLAHEHPSFVSLMTVQHVHTEAVVRPAEAILTILCGAGLSPQEARHAYQSLTGYILGVILQEKSGTIGLSCCSDGTKMSPLVAGAERASTMWTELPGERFPLLIATLSAAPTADPDAAFEFGLDLILDALEVRLRR